MTETEPIRLVGRLNSPETHDLRVFLARNEVTSHWVDIERDILARFLLGDRQSVTEMRLPVVLLPDGTHMESPTRAFHGRSGTETRPIVAGGTNIRAFRWRLQAMAAEHEPAVQL